MEVDHILTNQETAIKFFNDAFVHLESNFIVKGRTIKEWEEYFNIVIPVNLDIIEVRLLLNQATVLIQEAENICSSLEFTLSNLKTNEKKLINDSKNALLQNKHVKAVTKAETMARAEHADIIQSTQVGNAIFDFFDRQLKKLKTVSHLLESQNNNIMGEMKNIARGAYSPGHIND